MNELPDIQQIYQTVNWHNNQDGKHDKPGLFITVPKEIADQYPSEGRAGEDSSPVHITLLQFDTQFNGRLEDKAVEIIKAIVAKIKPFPAIIKAPRAFRKEDGSKVLHSPIKSSKLIKLHCILKQQLESALIPVSNKFPEYKPHITIQYVAPGQEPLPIPDPEGEFRINSLWLWNSSGEPFWIPFKNA